MIGALYSGSGWISLALYDHGIHYMKDISYALGDDRFWSGCLPFRTSKIICE